MARTSRAEGPAASRMPEPESTSGSAPARTHRGKKRQKRTVYSMEQLLQLEEFYKKKHHGTYEERETLAKKVNVDEHQVQVWLKNRRAKDRRLQRLQKQKGQGAQAAPQEQGVCASQPVPAPEPAGPAFQGDPVLPAGPEHPSGSVLPAGPLHYGGSAFCSLPPHSAFEDFLEAEPCIFSYNSQACWGPVQGVQGMVPAASAPVPVPAQATVSPQVPHAYGCSTNPVVIPGVTELRSPNRPSEGHFSSCQPWAEEEEDPYKLLDL